MACRYLVLDLQLLSYAIPISIGMDAARRQGLNSRIFPARYFVCKSSRILEQASHSPKELGSVRLHTTELHLSIEDYRNREHATDDRARFNGLGEHILS